MKKYFPIIIISICLLNARELEIGSAIPNIDHRLFDTRGEYLSLNDVKGKNGLLVIFSCNTCPWVVRWEDRYVIITEKYKNKGIGVIAINSNADQFDNKDSIEEMRNHAKNNNYNFPYVQDFGSKMAYAFGATRTPHIFLFDKNDTLVYRGAIDDNAKNAKKVKEPFLSDAISAMISGNPIEVSSTKALGCSIKFK
tara:strand:- start:2476 stop:3063 length:588 start_codon:yes stop_codon:yes gene_type:complete